MNWYEMELKRVSTGFGSNPDAVVMINPQTHDEVAFKAAVLSSSLPSVPQGTKHLCRFTGYAMGFDPAPGIPVITGSSSVHKVESVNGFRRVDNSEWRVFEGTILLSSPRFDGPSMPSVDGPSFTVSASALRKAIDHVSGQADAVEKTVCMKLSNDVLSVVAGNWTGASEAVVKGDFAFCDEFTVSVRPGDLSNLLSLATGPAGEDINVDVTVASDSSAINITFGSGTYRMGCPTTVTRESPRKVEGRRATLPPKWVSGVLARVARHASTDSGVDCDGIRAVRIDGGAATATDRMVLANISPEGCDGDWSFDLPLSAVQAITGMDDGGPCEVTVGESEIGFRFGSGTVVAGRNSTKYPNWQAVVPSKQPYWVKVDVPSLHHAASRLRVAIPRTSVGWGILLAKAHGGLRVTALTFMPGEPGDMSFENVPADNNLPDGFFIYFKESSLIDALKGIKGEATIGLESANRAMVVRQEDTGTMVLVMPHMNHREVTGIGGAR